MTTVGSRTVHRDKKVTLAEDSEESDFADYEEKDVYLLKKDGGYYPVRGQPGLFYKVFLL